MKDGLWIMAGVFLLHSAYYDLRCGMISVKSCLLAAGAGAVVRVIRAGGIFVHETSVPEMAVWMECVWGLLPGLFVMGLAAGSGEQIGKGDAWVMLALGVLVGAGRCMSLFMTALIFSLPFAAIWRFLNGRRSEWEQTRECSFPFVPNLFFAYVLFCCVP
ncbi:MAG: hypothetical protein HDR15_05030 [Lachnospiraceae bacterium]|nr:hypothetical protein [Lachnospiraceae bacterium]